MHEAPRRKSLDEDRDPLRFFSRRPGERYHPNLARLEIDITWSCNLRCRNCDRSCRQAPTEERMTLRQIEDFTARMRERELRWERITLLGGEPALHPELPGILEVLLEYRRAASPAAEIALVSNGHGPAVREVLAGLPGEVTLRVANRESPKQRFFEPFNIAPIDLPDLQEEDFSAGCWITADCGIGLNGRGYYPCAVAGGIDRVFDLGIALAEPPHTVKDLRPLLDAACRYCGHFLRGHFVDKPLRRPVEGEPMTTSWRLAYSRMKQQQGER
jgi:hypothetical protein